MGKKLTEIAADILAGKTINESVPQEPMHSIEKDEKFADKQGEQDLGPAIKTPRGKANSGPATADKGVSGRATKRPADNNPANEPMHTIPSPDDNSEGPDKFPKRPADVNSKQDPMRSLPDDLLSQGKGPQLTEDEELSEEEINELSKQTLGRYIKKAHVNATNNRAIKRALDDIKQHDLAATYGRKVVNRDIGINKAVDKLTKEDEADIEANNKKVQAQVHYEEELDEDMAALFNGEQLSEDFKNKARTIFEGAVAARVSAFEEQLIEAYETELENRVAAIQEELASQVENHLNYVVEGWLRENEVAIESGLRTELTEDFIAGLRNLFLEHYISVPEEEVNMIGELSDKIDTLTDRLNEEFENNVNLTAEVTALLKETTFLNLTRNLTESEVEKLRDLTEGVEFINEEDFSDKVETLYENYFNTKKSPSEKIINESIDNGGLETDADLLAEDLTTSQNSTMKRRIDFLKRTAR